MLTTKDFNIGCHLMRHSHEHDYETSEPQKWIFSERKPENTSMV